MQEWEKTGHRDGVEAEFQQPAGLCTEQGTIFVTDIAAGSVRMVISSSPLVKFLEFLNMFHKAIGVTLPNGPEGACSAQSVSDLKMMIDSLQQVLDLVRKVKPTFEERLNIKSCLTLVVENLFAEMRQGNDMPLVLQFSQRFHSCTRELLKRVTKSSFVYFTGENSYYHRTDNSYVSFQEIPRMDLPVKKKLSADQMSKLRCWRSEFGQSVRQNTVRGLTTKDKPGTLPLTCYEKGDTAVKEIDVEHLVELQEEVKCIMYHQANLLPLQFVSGMNTKVKSSGILGTIELEDVEVEDDTIILSVELYTSILPAKDAGDTISPEEMDEEEEELPKENQRKSKRDRHFRADPDFIYNC
ncbi:Hypothetical predicted protein [Mytilus galloprovincialis]|uniref:Uncharacterized protein n=1 Tax=Mytilus galloprovincialis TaxID=29158 RepID=A0A8B6EWW1_MYTGA|nr:Hypothetical predicted protein [Mytilus galloprovincialis]